MKVRKRDGRIVDFDINRIRNAIKGASQEADHKVKLDDLSNKVYSLLKKKKTPLLDVEEIQDEVEVVLMQEEPTVARKYILHREERSKQRRYRGEIYKKVENAIYPQEATNDNANVDDFSFGGRKFGAAGIVHKDMAKAMMPAHVLRAYEDMLVYIHDIDSYTVGMNNCLFADLQRLLKNGFATRNTDVRPANSFATACQLVAVIFQCQSQLGFVR